MQATFGLPVEAGWAPVLGALVAALASMLAVVAAQQPLLWTLSRRSMARRPGRTALLVGGLALSFAVITAALGLGESIAYSAVAGRLAKVGRVDETVSAGTPWGADDSTAALRATRATPGVAAATGGFVVGGIVVVFDSDTGQVAAENDLLALPPDFAQVWGTLHAADGAPLALGDLQGEGVLLGPTLAAALGARPGHRLQVFVAGRPVTCTVQAVLASDIATAPDELNYPGVQMLVIPLARYQELAGTPGAVNTLYVANAGHGSATGVAAITALRRQFPSAQVQDVRAAAGDPTAGAGTADPGASGAFATLLPLSDAVAVPFARLLAITGPCLVAAGLLLAYLLILLLAAERRPELGMARALGLKRRQVIQLFALEGGGYALAAGLLGLPLGVAAVTLQARFLAATPLRRGLRLPLTAHLTPTTLALAASLGLLASMAAILLAAYRASRLAIAAAIRDLDEPARAEGGLIAPVRALAAAVGPEGRAGGISAQVRAIVPAVAALIWALCRRGVVPLLVGLALLIRAIRAQVAARVHLAPGEPAVVHWPYPAAMALLLLGAGLALRWLALLAGRRADRATRLGFGAVGAGWLLYFAQPLGAVEGALGLAGRWGLGNAQPGPDAFLLASVLAVAGATVLALGNEALLGAAVASAAGRLRGWAPVARLGLAQALAQRGRTALAAGLFGLVTFILTLTLAIGQTAVRNTGVDRSTGGFQLQIDSPDQPADLAAQVRADPTLDRDFAAVGGAHRERLRIRRVVPGQQTQGGAGNVVAADDAFLTATEYALQLRATGYASDRQVWDAVRDRPGLAVMGYDPDVFTDLGPTQATFAPFEEEIQDAAGDRHRVTIIGLLPTETTWGFLYCSARTGAAFFGDRTTSPTWHAFRVRPGVDEGRAWLDLSAALGPRYGLEPELMRTKIAWRSGATAAMTTFLGGYAALGLLFGVAALGVISGRAVAERRQQIGLLRALGYSRALVRRAFLLEAGVTTALGVGSGMALGVWSAYLLTRSSFALPSDAFVLPLVPLALLLGGAALATAAAGALPVLPAMRGRPAEALRHE